MLPEGGGPEMGMKEDAYAAGISQTFLDALESPVSSFGTAAIFISATPDAGR